MDPIRQVVDLFRVKAERFFWQHFATDLRRAKHYLGEIDCLYAKLIAKAEEADKPELADGLFAEWLAKRQPEILEVERLQTIGLNQKAANYHVRTVRLTVADVWRAVGGTWAARHKQTSS
jgi:hypothetical protein